MVRNYGLSLPGEPVPDSSDVFFQVLFGAARSRGFENRYPGQNDTPAASVH